MEIEILRVPRERESAREPIPGFAWNVLGFGRKRERRDKRLLRERRITNEKKKKKKKKIVCNEICDWSILTSESAPLSAPGHVKVTYSWHRLWTTKLQTEIQAAKWNQRVLSSSTGGFYLYERERPTRSYLDTGTLAFRNPWNKNCSSWN